MYLRTYHRLTVEGTEHLPKSAPFVLIANHTSHLDALVLASILNSSLRSRTFPIAAADVFFERLAGAMLASIALNALPMHRMGRGRHSLDELRRRLVEDPCGYILFPEGTRSRTGTLSAFKPGVGMLVAGTSVPIVPCRLEGAFAALRAGQSLPRPKRITVRVRPPLRFSETPNDRAGWDSIATALAHQFA